MCILLLLTGIIVVGWQGFHYLLESGIDPNDPVDGIDVSSWQQEIDWDEVEDEGYEFAVVKATEGSDHVDPYFKANWKEANGTGLVVGAYHFLSFDTDGDTQAENFIDNVKGKRGNLPPTIDVELYGDYVNTPPDREKVENILDAVIDDLEEEYGKKPILYTNPHVYGLYLKGSKYQDHPIWISDPDRSEELEDGREWTFLQYTFEGESEAVGEGKHVDLNEFNGSLWDLKHLK